MLSFTLIRIYIFANAYAVMGISENHPIGTKSSIKIMSNIFIAFLGAGVLGLPFAFKEVN